MISPYVFPGLTTSDRYAPTLEEIIAAVCDHVKISPATLIARSRRRSIVRSRHLCFALAQRLNSTITVTEIAERFGLDYTTVVHGRQAINRDILHENGLRETIDILKQRIIQNNAQDELHP